MAWPIRILHLEDNRNDRELVSELLKEGGVDCEIIAVDTRGEFLQALHENPCQLILADFALPAFDGFSALNLARQIAPRVPFIFLSGVIGEERAVETLKSGATDYVLKNRLERLAPAVQRALQEAAERQRLLEVQEALLKSEERFRLLVQSIQDYAIYLVDPGGMVVSWNGGAQRIFGYSEHEAIGLSMRSFFRRSEAREHCYERLVRMAEEKGRAEQEIWQVRKDGGCFWANLIFTPLPGFHGYAVVAHDITSRQRELQELERSRQERARMQERFLGHISHELRTPLTTIVDFASLIHDGTAGLISDDQQRYLEIVLRAANQLAVMINSLLDLTRTDWRQLPILQECVSVEKLVSEVCQDFAAGAAEKNIQLRNLTSAPLPLAYADPSRVTEVLTNLIDNAIKYSPVGSQVQVVAERSTGESEFLRISVRDNGPGIQPQHQSHVFERFFRASEGTDSHPGGMGLGLYISREIVKAHGGDLQLSFNEAGGSTFHFTIPIFRLERILAPVVSPKNLAAGIAAVITVKTPEMPNCSSVDLRRYMRSVRESVRRCTHENSDLILPLIDVDQRPWVYLVALTKHDGVPWIVRRIREELEASLELQPLEGGFHVSSQVLDLSEYSGEDMAEATRQLARSVAAAIRLPAEAGEHDEHTAEETVASGR